MDSSLVTVYAVAGFFVLSMLVTLLWARSGMVDPQVAYGLRGTDATTPEATMTLDGIDPRAVADDLFNRVVDAAATGDTAQIQAFLPLAVAAYQEAGPLDPDGLFHLATLYRIGDHAEASLEGARAILELDPDHLLGLGAAAEASKLTGTPEETAALYRRVLEVYDVQIRRDLGEYRGHATFIDRVRDDALTLTGPP